MYVNYTDEAYVRQLALLKPSLLIISMGTNETFGRRFNTDEFSGQMEAFLALVKKELPNTAILLTTPPECYRRVRSGKQRTYVRNDNTERAARAIRNVAKKEEVACWDLFTTTGGKNSCRKWHSSRLMGRDRIHFTKEGYQEQGTLLFRAFMESYNNR
jgi:putative periplasmic protein